MRTHITKYQRTSRPRYLFALILVLALGLLAGCTQDLPLGSILSQDRAADASASEAATSPAFDLGSIPPNDGKGYVELNGGKPTFTEPTRIQKPRATERTPSMCSVMTVMPLSSTVFS